MRHKCYLLLGSNLGDRSRNLNLAISEVKKVSTNLIESKRYITEPWGFTSNESFLNVALEIETELNPYILLEVLLKIEKHLGRVRAIQKEETKSYSSRIIDIDILFYDRKIISSEHLIIPHPRFHLRNFALAPMCDLNKDLVHPVLNSKIWELYKQTTDKNTILAINKEA